MVDGCVRLDERKWWKTLKMGGEGDERSLDSGRRECRGRKIAIAGLCYSEVVFFVLYLGIVRVYPLGIATNY